MRNSTDVFVIGGGPAGLAAAIAARQQGFRVQVADGAKPPIDKACGEALMPDALVALEKLGVGITAADAAPLRGVRFLGSDCVADAAFPSGYRALSVRRTILHRILIERAVELGVDLFWQSVVSGIAGNEVRLNDRTVRADWIIGADGVQSRVRRWAKLGSQSRSALRYSFRRHYRVAPWTDRLEIYWGKHSQGYVTAVNGEEVCVAVASRSPEIRLDTALQEFPELSARLRGAEVTSSERGAVTANRKLKRVWRKNLSLIGDASGTVDAITGEGLGLAFSQALALADSLRSGDFAAYQTAHRRLALRPSFMARWMLLLDGRTRMQQQTLFILRKYPEVFRRLLAFHVGALSPMRAALGGLNLGWDC